MTIHEPIGRASMPLPHRFSQADYVVLCENGAFANYAKSELIEGVILTVNAQFSRHSRVQSLLLRLLGDACDALETGIGAWVEASVAIGDRSMPRPDIVVTRNLPDQGAIPVDLVALVVEVADSTLDADLGSKAELYATAGVGEYWVADAEGRVIHQLWSPIDGSYTERRECVFGDQITSTTISGLAIKTGKL